MRWAPNPTGSQGFVLTIGLIPLTAALVWSGCVPVSGGSYSPSWERLKHKRGSLCKLGYVRLPMGFGKANCLDRFAAP